MFKPPRKTYDNLDSVLWTERSSRAICPQKEKEGIIPRINHTCWKESRSRHLHTLTRKKSHSTPQTQTLPTPAAPSSHPRNAAAHAPSPNKCGKNSSSSFTLPSSALAKNGCTSAAAGVIRLIVGSRAGAAGDVRPAPRALRAPS